MLPDHADLVTRLAARGRPVRLLVTGGGTGGHTFPAVAVSRHARALLGSAGVACQVLYAGTAGGLEARVAAEEGIPFVALPAGKLRRARNPLRLASPANLADAARVPLGVARAVRLVRRFQPDVVLATGGYASVPVGLAAWLCHRPLVVHEQTVRLGLANRLLAPRATAVALSAPASLALLPAGARARAVVTGNPTRAELARGSAQAALTRLGWRGWTAGLPTVYATGGAQGAQQLNQLVWALLPGLLARANLLHQCGPRWQAAGQRHAAGLPAGLRGRYLPVGFLGPELADVLALADVVVGRSGAGTVAELTALGKPAVLIPLVTAAGGEQAHNARWLAEHGACVALVGEEATPERLARALGALLDDRQARQRMAQAARRLGRPDATEALTRVVLACCAAQHPTPTQPSPPG